MMAITRGVGGYPCCARRGVVGQEGNRHVEARSLNSLYTCACDHQQIEMQGEKIISRVADQGLNQFNTKSSLRNVF